VSQRGSTLKQIVDVANSVELAARSVRCDVEEVASLRLPAILHFDFKHFVVLEKFTKSKVWISDPAIGSRTLGIKEFSRHFTGVAVEISASPTYQRSRQKPPLGIIAMVRATHDFIPGVAQAAIFSVALQAFILIAPFLTQIMIDQGGLRGDKDLLTILFIGAVGLAAFNSICDFLRGYAAQKLSSVLAWDMSTRLFRHMVRLPLPWFQRRRLADVLTRFEALEPIRAIFTNGIVSAALDGVMSIFLIAAIFLYSWKIALVIMAGVIISTTIKFISVPKSVRLASSALQASISEKGKRIETIRAIQSIKSMCGENSRESEWSSRYGAYLVSARNSASFQQSIKSTLLFIDGATLAAVVYFGAKSIVDASVSVGMLYAILAYRQQLFMRSSALVDQYVQWRLLDVYTDRIADIALQQKEQRTDIPPSGAIAHGTVSLRAVSFKYSELDQPVLSGIDIDVGPGEFVAITGGSGSGKSTLLKILATLYKPMSGELLFDGVRASSLSISDIRSSVSVVTQEDELLSGTVLENVSFYEDNANEARVWDVLRVVEMEDDIKQMPMRLNSLVSETGNNFSAGQRQRLVLARAIYRNPKILLLDEATCHLDAPREERIMKSISAMKITRIMVTHRASAANLADKIYVVSEGRLSMVERIRAPVRLRVKDDRKSEDLASPH